jgi:predicted DNA-binding antitoxin AbrB/MazE fold protein
MGLFDSKTKKSVEVIYENGMLKPLSEIKLEEGKKYQALLSELEEKSEEVFGIFKEDIPLDKLRDEWR